MNIFGTSGPSAAEIQRESVVKAQITNNLKQAVQLLQKTHIHSDHPIRSEDSANAVCNVLEAVFLHELKAPVSKKLSYLAGYSSNSDALNFWNILEKVSHKDTVLQLNHLLQITTQVGLCRAWIRLALNDGVFESYLNALLDDQKTLRYYYKRTSYLRDLEHPGILMTYIQSLSVFQFELSYNSSMLNIWTHTPLMLAGLAAPQDPKPVIARDTHSPYRCPTPSHATPVITHPSPALTKPQTQQTKHKKNKVASRDVSGIGYVHQCGVRGVNPSTPPNTPQDPSALTRGDIDAIRSMTRNSGSDNSSTCASQISQPDPVDARQLEPNLPAIRQYSTITDSGSGRLEEMLKHPWTSPVEDIDDRHPTDEDRCSTRVSPLHNNDRLSVVNPRLTLTEHNVLGRVERDVHKQSPEHPVDRGIHKPEEFMQSDFDKELNPFEYDGSLNPFTSDCERNVCDDNQASGCDISASITQLEADLGTCVSHNAPDSVYDSSHKSMKSADAVSSECIVDKTNPFDVDDSNHNPVLESTNPFDVDSSKHEPVLRSTNLFDVYGSNHEHQLESTNPFDLNSSDHEPMLQSTNPFESDSSHVKSNQNDHVLQPEIKPIKSVTVMRTVSSTGRGHSQGQTVVVAKRSTIQNKNPPSSQSKTCSILPALEESHKQADTGNQKPQSNIPAVELISEDKISNCAASKGAEIVQEVDDIPQPSRSVTENGFSDESVENVFETSTQSHTRSLTESSSFPRLDVGKSPALEPELSTAMATSDSIELAREAISGLSSSLTDTVSAALEDSDSFQPKGNSLGFMEGWSSDFETSMRSERDLSVFSRSDSHGPIRINTTESFDNMLHNYGSSIDHVETVTMSEVIDGLPTTEDETTPALAQPHINELHTVASVDEDMMDEYEVLPDMMEKRAYLLEPRYQPMIDILGTVGREKGLDMQNYQCNSCVRPVGMFYGKPRVCGYDACYYCYECHQNDEAYIPARIVFNWDFRKQKVSRENYWFLDHSEDDPLLNVQLLNSKLYTHVAEMKEIKDMRVQLRYLRTYLFTCKLSVADSLRRQVWPKEYYYEDIHMYSLNDLLQVATGQLAQTLSRLIKFATKHIYDCGLCSQKGYICEICNDTKVIYPFEMDNTVRCDRCSSVYHTECKTPLRRCPKCERRLRRQSDHGELCHSPDGLSDYSFSPGPHSMAGVVS